jgi:hypothetical protein
MPVLVSGGWYRRRAAFSNNLGSGFGERYGRSPESLGWGNCCTDKLMAMLGKNRGDQTGKGPVVTPVWQHSKLKEHRCHWHCIASNGRNGIASWLDHYIPCHYPRCRCNYCCCHCCNGWHQQHCHEGRRIASWKHCHGVAGSLLVGSFNIAIVIATDGINNNNIAVLVVTAGRAKNNINRPNNATDGTNNIAVMEEGLLLGNILMAVAGLLLVGSFIVIIVTMDGTNNIAMMEEGLLLGNIVMAVAPFIVIETRRVDSKINGGTVVTNEVGMGIPGMSGW